jgi:hypothetical protein
MKQDSKWVPMIGTEVGGARLLAIPIKTRLAVASPFHGYLASTGSRKAFLHVFRTMLTTESHTLRERCTVTGVTVGWRRNRWMNTEAKSANNVALLPRCGSLQ